MGDELCGVMCFHSTGGCPSWMSSLRLLFFLVRRSARHVAVIAALIGVAWCPRASAQDDAAGPIFVDFNYDAPPGCPDENRAFQLLHSRSERVTRAAAHSGGQRLVVEIITDHAGFRGTLTVVRLDATEERRSMRGANCSEVVEALALTAALSIDPNATLTLSTPAAEGSGASHEPGVGAAGAASETGSDPSSAVNDGSSPGSSEAGASDRTLQPDAARQRFRYGAPGGSREPRLTVGLMLSFARIMNNSPHLGGGLTLGISRPGGRVLFPIEAHLTLQGLFEPDPNDPPRVSTRFFLAQIAYCPLRFGLMFNFSACGRVDLGTISGQSAGFENEDEATRFYAAAGVEGWIRAELSEHWGIWLVPGLGFPLTDRQFAVDPGQEVLASTLDLAWNVSLGFGWTF